MSLSFYLFVSAFCSTKYGVVYIPRLLKLIKIFWVKLEQKIHVVQVREHVKQAREAQKTWADSSFKQRRLLLRIMLKYILDHQELICQ
jgi:hypothetical protein